MMRVVLCVCFYLMATMAQEKNNKKTKFHDGLPTSSIIRKDVADKPKRRFKTLRNNN